MYTPLTGIGSAETGVHTHNLYFWQWGSLNWKCPPPFSAHTSLQSPGLVQCKMGMGCHVVCVPLTTYSLYRQGWELGLVNRQLVRKAGPLPGHSSVCQSHISCSHTEHWKYKVRNYTAPTLYSEHIIATVHTHNLAQAPLFKHTCQGINLNNILQHSRLAVNLQLIAPHGPRPKQQPWQRQAGTTPCLYLLRIRRKHKQTQRKTEGRGKS